MPDEGQVVVSNTTPLIALSLVDQLPILRELYREVLIPPAVHKEVVRGGGRAGAAELKGSAWIRVVELRDPVGVLLRAKKQSLIAEIRPFVERIRRGGIRLSDAVVEEALRLAGE